MILVNAVICRLQFIENTERGVCPLLKKKTSWYERRCYTMKCFVQLVSRCFGDIVAGQVARDISQCNIPCNGQNRCETSCKSCCREYNQVLLFVQLVLQRFWSLQGMLHCEMFRATCFATMSPKHRETSCTKHFTV